MIISTRWFTFQGFRRADLAGIPYGFFLMWKPQPAHPPGTEYSWGADSGGYYRFKFAPLRYSFWFGFYWYPWWKKSWDWPWTACLPRFEFVKGTPQ